ncbi:MAG: carboxypeptidase regulatory-like domain-containing protein, partial [Spirochaetales bacterium]|nr:carboxypeptidase regulatory-like domain-containing protein [Spirochaetales bacterium]
MKKHIVIALAVVSLILGLVISCEEPQVNLPTQYSTPTIKGTLSIPTSQNVSASEVYVKVIDGDGNTVTVQKANADGTFVVQNLNADKKYSVLFTSVEPEFTNRAVGGSGGVGGWLYDVVPAVQEGNNVGNVKLKPLGTIKGKALIDGESEHYDITVYIPGTSYIAKTDKDGSFSIYNVPEGKYTLRYTLDDHLPVMVNDVMLVCPEDVEKPEVKVKKVTLKSSLGSVEGRAILGDSNDSTGVKVNLESEDASHSYPAFTSKDGYYTISGIQPGRYRVIVSYEGYTSQMSSYFEVASGTLTKIDTLIELYSSSGYLKGTVSLNDSDTKSGLAVTIRSKDIGDTFTVMSDEGGAFTKRLKPGTYTVDFSHSGYSSYSVDATVVENNTTTLSAVTLYSVYGTIEGRSFSPEETVTLIDKEGNPIQTLQSSNDCTYKFSGIQSGTYSIKFSKTGFSSNTISDVVVTPSKTTTINGVELKSLYGTLKGVAGSEGDSVSLMKDGVVVETVTVDSSRHYSFKGIERGSYSVRFSREGYTPYESETVAVAAASETTINGKVLISIYGTIKGTSASEGETVYLVRNGVQIKSATTLESKEYVFSD